MKSFTYQTKAGKTEVVFHDRPAIPEQTEAGALYVADTNTAPIMREADGYSDNLAAVEIPAGEKEKNLGTISVILEAALKNGMGRDSLFVGFGGGVVTDMTGFSAAVYMRGAKLELVPTTLLAMADAAVGGKTGVDFGAYKNSVGAFYPAARIHIATPVLETLSEKEFLSGLAEVFKTALLYDQELFTLFAKKKDRILSRSQEVLSQIVGLCVKAKAAVVEKDLYETGERAFLNLGHTFGHALESTAGFGTVSHGEAVAWGIGRALALGERLGITTPAYRSEVSALLRDYGWQDTPVHPSVSSTENPAEKLLAAMRGDKKRKKGKLRFILQSKLNSTRIVEVGDTDILAVLS